MCGDAIVLINPFNMIKYVNLDFLTILLNIQIIANSWILVLLNFFFFAFIAWILLGMPIASVDFVFDKSCLWSKIHLGETLEL